MLKTGKSSKRNPSAFYTTMEILRELQKPSGIKSILTNCNVSFGRSGYPLGVTKSSDLVLTHSMMEGAIESPEDMYFQNRKKRPQERGRKKRRKGKWNPIDRLWNSENPENCGYMYLLEQD